MNRREALFSALVGMTGASLCVASVATRGEDVKFDSMDDVLESLSKARQAQAFTDEAIDVDVLKKIVAFGDSALSHRNGRPRVLSVVTNRELLKEIDAVAGLDSAKRLSFGGAPAAIIVSVTDDDSDFQHFAVGGTVERMIIAANLLGLQCKTVMAGLKQANEDPIRTKLGIPDGFNAYIALLIGKSESPLVDGMTGATSREANDDKTKFVD